MRQLAVHLLLKRCRCRGHSAFATCLQLRKGDFRMASDSALREQLTQLLRGGQAHATFDDVVREFPLDRIGVRPAGAPHSAWELLEHLRIAQNDILEFSLSAEHVSPKFPD